MSKKNKVSKLMLVAIVLLVVGVSCIIFKGFTPVSLDETGMLIEPYFFLLPVGFSFIFLSLITGALAFVSKMVKLSKK